MTSILPVDAVLQHCLRTYGGTVRIKENVIYIKIGKDKFHVNITDGARFGKFTLYHQNRGRSLNGKFYYHQQLLCRRLDYAIYQAFVHDFNKTIGIPNDREDWFKFKEDAMKYYDPIVNWEELGGNFFY